MGNLATPEALIARWEELCRDPSLNDLPYKIEINAWGKIEMSPASNRHGRLQGELAAELKRQLGGSVLTECSILTRIGIRCPDVAWASAGFLQRFAEITPYQCAPEICVEIASPSNTKAELDEKIGAYLAAGAREVWLASEEGKLRFFDTSGEQPTTSFPVSITLPPPLK